MDKKDRHFRWDTVLVILGITCFTVFGIICYKNETEDRQSEDTIAYLRNMREEITETEYSSDNVETVESQKPETIYDRLFETNEDMIGWLSIPDTVIDYPVMQTPDDEEYYLRRDFFGEKDKNGCLLLDTDSDIHMTSNNLLIHGHNMKSGAMFGTLQEYEDSSYGAAHNHFFFYTKEETREYVLLAVFYSQIYSKDEKVFKYYDFFQAKDEKQFDDFYQNIKQLSIYDTGVEAEYGDEFITLSTCAYHTQNGRFVVIGKRIQ